MQFLNPTYLWGLLLVLIPILIHLFQLRKYKLVYFSSLKFLKQLEIEQKRRSRLKELLLLITRILLICMLVLAFAHPYFPGKSDISSGKQTVGFYVDNSMSMENEADGQSLLDHAKKTAIEAVAQYPPDTRFILIHNEDLFTSRFPLEAKDAIGAIEMIQLSSSSSSLNNVLDRFRQIVSEQDAEKNVLHVFSDFQKSFLNTGSILENPNFPTLLEKLPDGTSNNIFIDSCWFSAPVNNIEKRHTLHARINNESDQDLNHFPVHLNIQDSLVAQETVTLESYSSADIEFSYNLDRTGWQKGNIEIRDYPVSFDNIFHFAYYISDEIPVLQIYSGRENVNMQALFESDSYFDYHHAESGSIPYQDLKIFKLIILNSLSEFSPNLTQLLSDYVDQGGSLIITPPDEGKMTGINTFTQKFKAPVFSNLLVRESEARIPENMKSFYADISMNPDQQVEWPSYSKYYRLVDNFSKSETILTNETGRPLLTRNSFGNGFIALSAAPLTEDFTNFQVHPLFIPFLYYLANTGAEKQNLYYRIGRLEPVSIDIENAPKRGQVEIIETEGAYNVIPLQFRDPVSGRLMLHLSNYNGSSGILELNRSDNTEALIAMNYVGSESLVDNLSTEEINSFINEYELSNISIDDRTGQYGPSENIKINGRTFPLARIFLLMAIVFITIESLIHRFKS